MTNPDICQIAAIAIAPMTARGSAVRPGRRMLMRRSSSTFQTGWRMPASRRAMRAWSTTVPSMRTLTPLVGLRIQAQIVPVTMNEIAIGSRKMLRKIDSPRMRWSMRIASSSPRSRQPPTKTTVNTALLKTSLGQKRGVEKIAS